MLIKWNSNAIAYSTTVVASTLMISVFQFYYVKLFLNNYQISTYWFNLAQVIYMVWNAINDPLFGYFQDYSKLDCLKHRRLNILYGAPLFVLSFLLPWFSWTGEHSPPWVAGLHLVFTLCCYDCMLTFVLLAHCSLFTETSRSQSDRQSNLIYSQVASILGSSSVFFCELFSHQMKDIQALQFMCVFIAIISYFLMRYTGHNVTVAVDRDVTAPPNEDQGWRLGLTTSLQILRNRNFISFVIMNFLQIFHLAFCANFFIIFREALIGSQGVLPLFQSLLAGSAFMLPPLTILLLNPVLRRYGSYVLIKFSFLIKICMAIMLYGFGYESVFGIAVFMVLDNTFVSAAFGLFNLSVSNIIDEDQSTHGRSVPVSSMVYGLNALITKPAWSLSPMVIVYVLKLYGYQTNKVSGSVGSSSAVKDVMFSILVIIPVIVGFLQLLCWKMFTLRDANKQSAI